MYSDIFAGGRIGNCKGRRVTAGSIVLGSTVVFTVELTIAGTRFNSQTIEMGVHQEKWLDTRVTLKRTSEASWVINLDGMFCTLDKKRENHLDFYEFHAVESIERPQPYVSPLSMGMVAAPFAASLWTGALADASAPLPFYELVETSSWYQLTSIVNPLAFT
ncbi:hypothetical protein [Shimazuella kribbensis]|uniref:hypothetical protein n=1 Tax=Shimazuella kribbensis TaxID=139808 RepID=UPI00048BEB8A|nr:hypothetical protein [Shimazuella kribbensis]